MVPSRTCKVSFLGGGVPPKLVSRRRRRLGHPRLWPIVDAEGVVDRDEGASAGCGWHLVWRGRDRNGLNPPTRRKVTFGSRHAILRCVAIDSSSGVGLEALSGGLAQIGEVGERVGLSLRTLRYWEEVGLVTPSARTEGGFRLYSDEDVARILVLKQMKPLGLTLDEMKGLLALVEVSGEAHALSLAELGGAIERLRGWVERSDEAIEKLGRRMGEAHQLRLQLGERLSGCEATLKATRAGKQTGRRRAS